MDIFTQISLLLAVGAVMAAVMRALRQPLIIGHIITGILVGPSVLGLIRSPEEIEVFSSFGITLLLFIVGLGLNPKVVKEVGKISLLTGVGQVIFTTAIGFVLIRALGYNSITSLYVSIALAFSSTIIVLKLLTDKKEQNKLYGKISIGFLLVQDIIATIALLVASASSRGGLSYDELASLSVKGAALLTGVFIIAHFIFRPMTSFLSRSQEMLFLFAIAWGFGIASLAFNLGFSLEIGALFAGIALASMPYAQEIAARLRPLRDFFIVVFFIVLGAKLNLANIGNVIVPAIGLSLFVLVGNPIVVMCIMGLFGYTKKNSFKAGLAVAQISEFSVIFILLGQRNGQVGETAVSLVTIVGIVTIALSSYMIIYADSLFKALERYLQLFERRKARERREPKITHDAILFGYLHGGQEFVNVFKTVAKRYVVIDYDPDAIDQMEHKQIPYLYGDATDTELLEEAGIDKAKLIVSKIGDYESNHLLLQIIEKQNPNAVVIVHAETIPQADELYGLGASYVMLPHYIGSEHISSFIRKSGLRKSEFRRFREKHLAYLHAHYALADTE